MNAGFITSGLLGQGIVTGGYFQGAITAITDFADPRQGTILYPDSDPLGVDPRQGTILYADMDSNAVDPRQGSILSPDSDPDAVDPRQGGIIN